MPELPEVETIARLIRPRVEDRRIQAAQVGWVRSLGGLSRPAFARAVGGATIRRVRRRGKHVVLELARDGRAAGALVVHLRMTGRLQVEPRARPADPIVRVALDLDDGYALRFLDVRKFGRFTFVRDPRAFLAHLGPEPLSAAFRAGAFARALAARRRMLKPLLLDQTFVAGLGNIYVDESLHAARLHPQRAASSLRAPAVRALHRAIRRVLRAAVARQGSSFDRFYRTPEGRPGSYQHEFRVYGRAGQSCPRCGGTIRRIVVAQRGTHLCPRCQRPPRGLRTPAAPPSGPPCA
jgi:formamidopyrimidine-DNA glycosylase